MQLSPFGCDWQSCVFAQMIPIHWPRVIIDKTSTSTVEMERCYALIRNVKYRHHTLHMRVNTNICCVASSSIPDDDTRKICTNSRWMQFNLDVVTVMSTNNGTNNNNQADWPRRTLIYFSGWCDLLVLRMTTAIMVHDGISWMMPKNIAYDVHIVLV